MLNSESVHSRALCVGVVIPAHNESRHLVGVVTDLPAWIDHILIVDDCSTDNTLVVAQGLEDDRVQVIHHEENTGVGGAMRSGYLLALKYGCDVIVKMDADGQMDASELPLLLRPIRLGMADYSKGNRFRRSGRPQEMPAGRWFGNVALSFLTKIASGYWHVFDPQCGFTAITAAALRRLRLDGIASDYFFENDMLVHLNVMDARVVDVSTAAQYGTEVSGLSIRRILWSFPLRLIRRSIWRFIKRHVVNDFGLVAVLATVGAAFTLFAVAYGAYHWIESAASGTPATAGTVMIAVVPLILGVQMLLQGLALEVQSSPGAEETRRLARMDDDVGLVWTGDEDAESLRSDSSGHPRSAV